MQDTEAPPRAVRPRASRARRIGGAIRRDLWVAGWIVLGLGVAGALALTGFRVARSGSLPNVEVAGAEVGGLGRDALRARIEDLAATLGGRSIEITRTAVGADPTRSLSFTAADLGYRVDIEATVDEVLHRGRQGNPVGALGDHLRATFGRIRVDPIEILDQDVFDDWVRRTADALSTVPIEGDLVFQGAVVTPVFPSPGAEVLQDELAARALAALASLRSGSIVVATRQLAPETTDEVVEAALGQAVQLLSGPVKLTHGDVSLSFSPAELGAVFHAEPVTIEDIVQLRLVADPQAVEEIVADRIARIESDPVDARFELAGGAIHIVPGRKGFRFDAEKAADQLLDVAATESRTAALKGTTVPPDFTVADAKALRIDEKVSSFTTYHPCCEARVTNIHRIADILDGTVIMPGETFSVNEAVGVRTEENGFVPAPAIRNGEFVEEVGGGISQFATTTFNAIFFGGYEFVEYKAHSYYFSRYPLGREATVSWPWPDLKFTNDSDAGIFIDTSYTDTSITVAFYGHTDVEIDSTTSQPFNFTEPETECMENPALADGEVVTTQEGAQGYDVVVERIFRYPDGSSSSERFFTRYLAKPEIVEQRTCEAPPE